MQKERNKNKNSSKNGINRLKKRIRTRIRVFLSTLFIILIAMLGVSTTNDLEVPEGGNAPLTVHFLDVGQGSSVLLESDGHYALVDGGDRDASSFVVSYLEEQGVDSLDYVIASHYDADHLNGIVGALNAFDVKQVLCPDYAGTSKVYDSFWKTVSQKQIPYEYPEPGAHYVLGEATFIVVGPVSYKYDDANNNSIVMKVVNLQDSFLITGDAERESEEDMCAAGIDLSCTVYMAGHHGSASSTTWDLLERALPEYVVVSCGKDNSYGHPHEETLEKIQSIDARLFRTDLQGTVVAVSSGKGITWNVNSLD